MKAEGGVDFQRSSNNSPGTSTGRAFLKTDTKSFHRRSKNSSAFKFGVSPQALPKLKLNARVNYLSRLLMHATAGDWKKDKYWRG